MNGVCVLEIVNQYPCVAIGSRLPDFLVRSKELSRRDKQVVKVEDRRVALELFEIREEPVELRRKRRDEGGGDPPEQNAERVAAPPVMRRRLF